MPYKDKEKQKAAQLAYYYRNREVCRERRKRWRAQNEEHIREYNKTYDDKNPDKRRAHRRRYDAKHRDKRLMQKRQWYRRNRERLLEKHRQYNEEVRQGIRQPLHTGPRTVTLPVPIVTSRASPVAEVARQINQRREAMALAEKKLRETLHREYDGKLSGEMIDKFLRELRRLMRGGANSFNVSNHPNPEGTPAPGTGESIHSPKDENV